MSYVSEVLADSPRAYWRLGSDPTLDSSGNGFTLSTVGTVPAATGIVPSERTDGSRDFDGTTSNFYSIAAVSIPDSLDYPGTAAFTLECWAQCDFSDTDFVRLLSHESATDGWMLYAQTNDGYGMGRNASSVFDTTHTKQDNFIGGVYHVVGVFNGTQQIVYLNGVAGTPNADTASIVDFSATLRIGRSSLGGDTFDGRIDEVAVYDGALSSARILAHYNAGLLAPGLGDDPPFGFSGRGAGW